MLDRAATVTSLIETAVPKKCLGDNEKLKICRKFRRKRLFGDLNANERITQEENAGEIGMILVYVICFCVIYRNKYTNYFGEWPDCAIVFHRQTTRTKGM
jgi:hypothetical protein